MIDAWLTGFVPFTKDAETVQINRRGSNKVALEVADHDSYYFSTSSGCPRCRSAALHIICNERVSSVILSEIADQEQMEAGLLSLDAS